jgi:DNA repair photolyase
MRIREIQAKTILRKYKKIDSWFIIRYGMNLYRGCAHDCVYCDGRAERYQVDGEFGEDVAVKTNAIDVLRRELDPARKRIAFKPAFFALGGGVGDSYQPAEKEYQLTRKALQLMLDYKHPVHILTKSTLIERDIDLLKKINAVSKVLVSFSFSSVDEGTSALFEPGVPTPDARLKTLSRIKEAGIHCGMFLMPVIPFITDTPDMIRSCMEKAVENRLDYIVFSGMTLKEGRQMQHFYDVIERHYPDLTLEYQTIYTKNPWGQASQVYYDDIHRTFHTISRLYDIPVRIPASLFRDILGLNDLIVVILEQIDYLHKLRGQSSPYGYAAHTISGLKEPITEYRYKLRTLKGIGKVTERLIAQIIETRQSKYYEYLMHGDKHGA